MVNVVIDAEGDSTMYGSVPQPFGDSSHSAPAVLQTLLQQQFGSTVTVVNLGVPGAFAYASLQGESPWYTVPFATRLSGYTAQIVISNYGINDSNYRTTEQYAQDLTDWIATVRAAGKTPVLEEPNPTCNKIIPNEALYVPVLRQVAAANGVLLIAQYDYILSLTAWQGMLQDCIHPGADLYAIKAQREYAAILPLVTALKVSP